MLSLWAAHINGAQLSKYGLQLLLNADVSTNMVDENKCTALMPAANKAELSYGAIDAGPSAFAY